MPSPNEIVTTFAKNLESVRELVNFDRIVLDSVTGNLARICEDLAETNPALARRIGNTESSIQQIREHDSLRRNYATIYNQCVVLLVSHFGSALHELFISVAPSRLANISDKEAEREELKFSIAELRESGYDLREVIGQLIVAKRDVSFQDMQSTIRAYKTYLGVSIDRDRHADNIIFAQAARHVIVHAGATVDSRFLRQVSMATLRELKSQVSEREQLAFTPAEIETLASSMGQFIERIVNALER